MSGEGAGRAQVQYGPFRFGDRLVRGPARQLVREGVGSARRRDDAFFQSRGEGTAGLPLAQPRDRSQ
ncbi:hypothetical protein SMICM17S_10662 [Streptomyces microflavus]